MGAAKKIKKSILDCFPAHLTPRQVQANALLELEAVWHQADVFVVNLPVASGKSAIAMTLAKWCGKASIITPSKLLVDQYKDEYPAIQVLRAKADYFCSTFGVPLNKRPVRKNQPKTCPDSAGCIGCKTYRKDLAKARVYNYLLSNYWIYLAHGLYRDTLVVDEAHQLISMLQQMSSKKLWYNKYKFPSSIETREDMVRWVNSPENGWNRALDPTYKKFKQELLSNRPRFIFKVSEEPYRDTTDTCISMRPIDVSDEPPIMWPDKVKKMVLLSATLSRKDIEQLGLSDKKIMYIEADSPITADRRPVNIPKEAASMAYAQQTENIPKLIDYILETTNKHPTEKGLIHATYSLAEKIKQAIKHDTKENSRYIFHTKEDKAEKYQIFRDSEEPKILVASGMYEGIDLPYDAGRWQIIAKVPYPSLADPAIKYMVGLDKEWYSWETIKVVLQACGRICRTPEDYGITYIFDNSFKRLYNQNKDWGFPLWFQNSVRFKDE